MPSYDLQHGTATGGTVDCGNLLVSNANNQTTISYLAQGQSGNGTTIPGAKYTAKAGGGGTALNPAAGDTMNLNGYQVTVGTTVYTFSGDATYRDPGNGQGGGYFKAAGITGALDDWDAADQGPDPKA